MYDGSVLCEIKGFVRFVVWGEDWIEGEVDFVLCDEDRVEIVWGLVW